jgi:plastocyanin
MPTPMKTLICAAVIPLLVIGIATSASAGDLTGRVTVAGAPTDETIVVWIDGPVAAAPAPKHAVITQSGIRFSPTFLVVVAGQTVDMPNDDNIAHNVYSVSTAKKFNLGVYEKGQSRSVTFEKSGLVDVSCWLHKRMNATILVVPNRFFARVIRGQYRISGVPPGTYRLVATRPGAPQAVKKAVVAAGNPPGVDFNF